MIEIKTLLLVWVYYPAVGHLVEALEVAANYHKANPNLKIHLLVNQKTPWRVGEFCNFIESVHPIKVSDHPKIIDISKTEFDYIVFPQRLKYTPQDYPEILLNCNLYLQKYFKAKVWQGFYNSPHDPKELEFRPYSSFELKIPENKISIKLPNAPGYPLVAMMLKGASKDSIWPTKKTWQQICKQIKKKYPEAVFLITGISSVHKTPKKSINIVQHELAQFINSIPDAYNYYDIGLENQLGLIQKADVFLSPHTGFAFLAPCLGTSWLCLSGGEWAEPMPAKMPFYSVLPNCKFYPCNNGDKKLECRLRIKLNRPIQCMSHLYQKQEDILLGIEKLLNPNYSFAEAFEDYEDSAKQNQVNFKKLWRIKAYATSANQ